MGAQDVGREPLPPNDRLSHIFTLCPHLPRGLQVDSLVGLLSQVGVKMCEDHSTTSFIWSRNLMPLS